jgi:hypothetical protein
VNTQIFKKLKASAARTGIHAFIQKKHPARRSLAT